MSLLVNKLLKTPIGTHLDVCVRLASNGEKIEQISGILTDNDYTESFQITTFEGVDQIFDYSLLMSFTPTKKLDDILKELSQGDRVKLSYGGEDQKEPNIVATVDENDGNEIALRTDAGEDICLAHALVRSLLVLEKKSAPAPAATPTAAPDPARPTATPTGKPGSPAPQPQPISGRKDTLLKRETLALDILDTSDRALEKLFSRLNRAEKRAFQSFFDSFKDGVKNVDYEKMYTASQRARGEIFRKAKTYSDQPSTSVVVLVGSLTIRAKVPDPQVFLLKALYEEAAFAAYIAKQPDLAGACAIAALLNPVEGNDHTEAMAVILAHSVVNGDDLSGLRILAENAPPELEPLLRRILVEVAQKVNITYPATQSVLQTLQMLAVSDYYPNDKTAREVRKLLPELPELSDLSAPAAAAPTKAPKKSASAAKPKPQESFNGLITSVSWVAETGTITDEDGIGYAFRYADITDNALRKCIKDVMRSDMGGHVLPVLFCKNGNAATNIRSDIPAHLRAEKIAAARTAEAYEKAYCLCRRVLRITPDAEALAGLARYAALYYGQTGSGKYGEEVIGLFEANSAVYPQKSQDLMNIAHCYRYIGNYRKMSEYAEMALKCTDGTLQERQYVVTQYMKEMLEYYESCGDKNLLAAILAADKRLYEQRGEELAQLPDVEKLHRRFGLPTVIRAECLLDMAEEAEAHYACLSDEKKAELADLMEEMRKRCGAKDPASEEASDAPDADPSEEASPEDTASDDDSEEEDIEDEEEEEAVIIPYVDRDGWAALGLTKEDVIDYALSLQGKGRLAPMLAYLHAGALLNEEIAPTYRAVALAVDDPASESDYSVEQLFDTLAKNDPAYPVLGDHCMAAAFLRAAFVSDEDVDNVVRVPREEIFARLGIPALSEAYELLGQFRAESGSAIDLYADYRMADTEEAEMQAAAAINYAKILYIKYILTPPTDNLARGNATKRILFAKDGYLATMLRHVIDGEREALANEKAAFAATYFRGKDLSVANLDRNTIEVLIDEAWNETLKENVKYRKASDLQGTRRNQLRAALSDILDTIRWWYRIEERSAGAARKTETGVATYQKLRPQISEQLHKIAEICDEASQSADDPERCASLFLLSMTAKELANRLNGRWASRMNKYLYTDFLRTNYIMLDKDFLPELSDTFCALPDFNVLARIRKHVEERENYNFPEQLKRIYSRDQHCNNYGTAEQIVAYLDERGLDASSDLPENTKLYVDQTALSAYRHSRAFLESYALAVGYGRIMQEDRFCSSLENTARYWYAHCCETRNYGFFVTFTEHAERRIIESALAYQKRLEEQLEGLIADNRAEFAKHADYEAAIREQIEQQHFTTAEDWMSHVGNGDFTLALEKQEALTYLDNFLQTYANGQLIGKISNTRLPLSGLLTPKIVRNKSDRGGQMLIDYWLSNGNPSNPERVAKLLNLLGWENVNVTKSTLAQEPKLEVYLVEKREHSQQPVHPPHPIAAFGSASDPMYVVCLYGTYNADGLLTKMKSLDVLNGSKLILLDHVLGQIHRRDLAYRLKMRQNSLRHVNIVIDRTLIKHLSDNYDETKISRMVMAATVPFSYCQPYVADSMHVLPPEMFIGREDELLKIEKHDGVNLIFGGRQVGKSALLKKALSDVDGWDGQRAACIDINLCDAAESARKVSRELIEQGILPDAEPTDDWDVLCDCIKQRLCDESAEIRYFLLLMDEADTFIRDCANTNYEPLVKLKDLQIGLNGKFKFVLAGLHNVVKFYGESLRNNSVMIHLPALNITPFGESDAQELLTKPMSYLGLSLPSKEMVTLILRNCNYFPSMIQLYAKKLVESLREPDYAGYKKTLSPPYLVTDEHLRRVMADKEFKDKFRQNFNSTITLDADLGNCYHPLTLLIGYKYHTEYNSDGYTAAEVLKTAKDYNIQPLAGMEEGKINALLQELQALNVLRERKSDTYLLAAKIYLDLLGSADEIFNELSKYEGDAV